MPKNAIGVADQSGLAIALRRQRGGVSMQKKNKRTFKSITARNEYTAGALHASIGAKPE
jgi:hypothetical protein